MSTPTRDRIVSASASLFRHQGYSGTGLKQVVDASAAPFGSIYHFFPGGKQELAAEGLRAGGAHYLALYEEIAAGAPSTPVAVSRFFRGAAATLEASGYADACPIATVATEVANTNDELRAVCAEVFASWLAALSRDLRAAGVPRARARTSALAVIALLEGAFLLCRTLRETAPMTSAGQAARALVDAAVP